MKQHASQLIESGWPKYHLPNKQHSKGNVRPKRRSRGATRTKSVAKSSSARADKSELGMSNSFVPGLTKAKFRSRLRYGAASLSFTASTGLVGTYVFTANGLFDPNITGGALSPAGFAQLIATYEHYTVVSSKISVIFTNNSTTPTIVAIALEPDVSGSTDPNNMLELPFEQIVQLEPAGAYGSSKTLAMSTSLSKYFGVDVMDSQSLYRGDATSNPLEQAYYHLKCFGLKGGSAEVFITVKIEYTAMFTEPRELSPSLTASVLQMVLAESKERKEEDELVILTKRASFPVTGKGVRPP